MFNFHKPRVYRSTEGCCICRAKSSSSRFTDSRKYETESMQCFNLQHPRHGEICNACVLLVKRYKRLPVGNKRHWAHVVDARAGPGTKSMAKHRKREEMNSDSNGGSNGNSNRSSSSKSFIPEKFAKIFKKNRKQTNGKGLTSTSASAASTAEESSRRLQQKIGKETTSQTKQSNSTDSDSNESSDEQMMMDYDTPPPLPPPPATYTPTTSVASTPQPTVVQFQTKTRSAAQKQQLAALANATNNVKDNKKITGSNRRRMAAPKKNYCRVVITKTPFFDLDNFENIICCCGVVRYSSAHKFVVVDEEDYRPCGCEKHRSSASSINKPSPLVTKSTITTETEELPMTIEEQAKQPTPMMMMTTTTTRLENVIIPSGSNEVKPLKKHHLFFKRQSESFPTHVEDNSPPTPPMVKTESIKMPSLINQNPATGGGIATTNTYADTVNCQSSRHSKITSLTTSASPMINGGTVSSSAGITENCAAATTKSSSPLILRTTAIVGANGNIAAVVPVVNIRYEKQQQQLQHHQQQHRQQQTSMNPTHRTPLTTVACAPSPSGLSSSSSCSSTSSTKFNDNSSDSGFDENPQDRKTSSTLVDSIPMSPPAAVQQSQQQQQQQEEEEETEMQQDGALVIEEGIDMEVEGEEIISITEEEIIVNPPAGRLVLTNGVQINGLLHNPHNIILTGNEYGARIMQQQVISPLPSPTSTSSNKGSHHHHHRYNLNHHQHPHHISNSSNNNNGNDNIESISRNNGSCNKLRAIYNSVNNTIEHENGVTTILPASSLAASNQTAAMNAIVPSTVTISPAPSAASNGIGAIKKISLTGHLQPLALTTNVNNLIQLQQQPSNNVTKSVVANQKIIFVKHNA